MKEQPQHSSTPWLGGLAALPRTPEEGLHSGSFSILGMTSSASSLAPLRRAARGCKLDLQKEMQKSYVVRGENKNELAKNVVAFLFQHKSHVRRLPISAVQISVPVVDL